MMKYIITLIFAFLAITGHTQEVVFEKNNKDILELNLKNTTSKSFSPIIGFGWAAGNPEIPNGNIVYKNSTQFYFGGRFKQTITNFYATGFSVLIDNQNFRIDQNVILKQNLKYRNLHIDWFNRFKNNLNVYFLGEYLDLGLYGNWAFSTSQIFTITSPKIVHAKTVVTSEKQLQFIEPFGYGLKARIGYNWFSFYAQYRASNMFKKNLWYTEFPRFIIGIEIGGF